MCPRIGHDQDQFRIILLPYLLPEWKVLLFDCRIHITYSLNDYNYKVT